MSEVVKEVTAEAEPKMCKKREILGHAIGVLGHDGLSNLHGTWIVPFMTDVLVLPAAFLGILLAVIRIFDGITDVAMGFIADTTKSRFGRYRAWLLRSGPIYAVFVALSFLVPGESMVVKMIYCGVLYAVTGSVAFTSVDIPFWSLPAAMTSNTQERSTIVSLTTAASSVVAGVVGIVMPLALDAFGGSGNAGAYFAPAAILAAFGMVMYLISFALVREHVHPDPQQKFHVGLALKNIYTNKPLLLLQLSNIFVLFAIIMRMSFNFYYCQYNLGDVKIMAVLSILSLFCSIGGGLLFPVFAKALGKRNTMFALAAVYAICALVRYFSGWDHIMVLYVTHVIASVCTGCCLISVNAMMMDTIEYGEWKTGQRNEGLITATRCFVSKLVMAFVGIVVAIVIGMTGYNPQGAQTMTTLNAFHFVYTAGCAICMFAAVIPLFFYNLTEKRHAEIMAELAARKAAKGDK